MKHHRYLPILISGLILLSAGCAKTDSGSHRLTEGSLEGTKGSGTEVSEQASLPAEPSDSVQDNENKENQGSITKVTVRDWSHDKAVKYSDQGRLIYEWERRTPEVLIPESLEAQYRANHHLRELIAEEYSYEFTSDAISYYNDMRKINETWQPYSSISDYSILKNDGRILSLRQDFYTYTGGAHGFYGSILCSLDTKTGALLTLNSLSADPKALELVLKQEIVDQINNIPDSGLFTDQVMSGELPDFVLLTEGMLVHYDVYILGSYAHGAQDFLIPYERFLEYFNDYGKELAEYAQKTGDEPQKQDSEPEYLLPQSSTEYLAGGDLLDMDPDDLRLARNEIFARHGRIFDAPDLKVYFESKTWYQPQISSEDFKDSVFNEYEKRNLDLIRTAENQLASKEITNAGTALEPDKEYQFDLDGNGTLESISWTPVSDPLVNDYFYSGLTLTINGVVQNCFPGDLRGSIDLSVIDLKKDDRELELLLSITEDSDTLSTLSLYRFQDGMLCMISDLSGKVCEGQGYLYRYNGLRAMGDGLLYVKADTPFGGSSQTFGCFYIDLLFSYENGELKEVIQDIYPKQDYGMVLSAFEHESDWQYYTAAKAFTVMKEPGGSNPAFEVKAGETACPVAWSLKNGKIYVYIMNEAGACGWVLDENPEVWSEDKLYVNAPAWG